MTAPDIVSRTAALSTLRVVAVVGVILALAMVGFAFSRGVLLGVVALAAAPAVPLALVVAADRVFRR